MSITAALPDIQYQSIGDRQSSSAEFSIRHAPYYRRCRQSTRSPATCLCSHACICMDLNAGLVMTTRYRMMVFIICGQNPRTSRVSLSCFGFQRYYHLPDYYRWRLSSFPFAMKTSSADTSPATGCWETLTVRAATDSQNARGEHLLGLLTHGWTAPPT